MSTLPPTLVELAGATRASHAERIFLHHQSRDWTYDDVFARAEAAAAWMRAEGLAPGDRVGLLLPNGLEYVVAYLAAILTGGVVVPLNPDSTARELAGTLAHAAPKIVIATTKSWSAIAPIDSLLTELRGAVYVGSSAPVRLARSVPLVSFDEAMTYPAIDFEPHRPTAEAVAQLIYTSGTSGQPKGVALTHTNLIANTASIIAGLALSSSDSVFVILPFYYSYGNSLLLTHLAVGGRLILASDFVFWNRTLDLMASQAATGFAGVPSSYAMLLERSDFGRREFPCLRYLTCAGGALPTVRVNELLACFPRAKLHLMYGQTEAAARLSMLSPDELPARIGSIGRGLDGVTLVVVDADGYEVPPGQVGEIVARGENVMAGYWNDPVATGLAIRNGWLFTGDLAKRDDDGFLYIEGRQSDLLKCGAYRIHPQEIESVIAEHPSVAEVAVTGEADPILGETPAAYVVIKPGRDADADAILQHTAEQLPRHKQPKRVYFLDALPKTSTGKVRRIALRELNAA